MKFRDLFQDVEDWFWKLEFNPETSLYELFLGIPNDWIYSEKNDLITIELIHELAENSIVKISSVDESITIDDILDTAKLLISKNQELEIRKQRHKEEMEKLKEMLIEKEKNFLVYIDTVKDNTVKQVENPVLGQSTGDDGETEGTSEEVNEGINEDANDVVKVADDFLNDIEKLKLK